MLLMPDKPEIDHIAPVGGGGGEAGGAGLVFLGREGLGIDFFQDELAVADSAAYSPQQIAHPLGIGGDRRDNGEPTSRE